MDTEGLLWGFSAYFIAFLVSLGIYKKYISFIHVNVFFVILLCFIGHYISCFVYSQNSSDSFIYFFTQANSSYTTLGTGFVKNMCWYVRQYFTGDSYLATLYFFSAFSCLGSILWYIVYLKSTHLLKISAQKYFFPAIIIMCWPSWLLFTSGIGKDSICFFAIPLILLLWNQLAYEKNISLTSILIFLLSLLLLTLIRPYLLMIFVISYFLSLIDFNNLSIMRIILIILFIPITVYVIKWTLVVQGGFNNNIEVYDVMNKVVNQQEMLSAGTSFPILSKNPIVAVLSLPYSFVMNLIMPMFIFANNGIGILASIENVFLSRFLYLLWTHRVFFKKIRSDSKFIKLCFSFFIVGMSFLSLANTNLGLAMRQKSMYVPPILILAMLVWTYNRHNCFKRKVRQFQILNTPELA